MFALLAFVASALAETTNAVSPNFVVNKFQIAQFEVLNLDSSYYSEFLFKENNCETSGYSFFSPFYLDKDLAYAKLTSYVKEDEAFISVDKEGAKFNYYISDITISSDGTSAEMNVNSENTIYKSMLYGENLTKEDVLSLFSASSGLDLVQAPACPPCALAALIIIADVVTDVCETAQNACNDCEKRKVGFCTCECL